MWAAIWSVVAALASGLIKKLLPSPEQKANQILLDERNKALNDVQKAKDIRDKLANEPDSLPDKYQRD